MFQVDPREIMARGRAAPRDGFTLVEVIVSLVILGVSFLALSQLFWYSTASGSESLYRTRAHIQAIDMGERLWLDLSDPEATVSDWQDQHEASMPGWTGEVTVEDLSDFNLYTITIEWAGSATHPPGNASYLVRTPLMATP